MSAGVLDRPSGVRVWARSNPCFALVAGHERQPRRDPDDADPRRERHGEQPRRFLQRRLRQRVRQEVRVRVEELLVEQVDHHAVRLRRQLVVQRLREQHRGGDVGAHRAHEVLAAEGRRVVVLEQRRVVDDAGHRAELVRALREQALHARLDGEVAVDGDGAPAELLDVGDGPQRVVARGRVVDRDIPAVGRERERDLPPDAARGARDERGAVPRFATCDHGGGSVPARPVGPRYHRTMVHPPPMPPRLPPPDPVAAEHSARLQRSIVEAIRAAGGWIRLRSLHGTRALRAGPRLLRGGRTQVRRRGRGRRLRDRAGDLAAVRVGAGHAGRPGVRARAGAHRGVRRRLRRARARPAGRAGRARRRDRALLDRRTVAGPGGAPARAARRPRRRVAGRAAATGSTA